MKTFKAICTALTLAFVLSTPVFGGDISTPGISGDISTPGITTGDSRAVEDTASSALMDFLWTAMTLF